MSDTTTITIDGHTITCNASDLGLILSQLVSAAPATTTKPVSQPKATAKPKADPKPKSKTRKTTPKTTPKPDPKPAPENSPEWYDEFVTPDTTVEHTPLMTTVKVKRGHADEWHDRLRAAGFRWSKKGFWWANNDPTKRAEQAARNIKADSETAGMSYQERCAYWSARKANRAAA